MYFFYIFVDFTKKKLHWCNYVSFVKFASGGGLAKRTRRPRATGEKKENLHFFCFVRVRKWVGPFKDRLLQNLLSFSTRGDDELPSMRGGALEEDGDDKPER